MRALDLILKLEWASVALLAIVGFFMLDGSWWLFALLILVPDLSFLGYAAGPRLGAIAYNALHVLFAPLLLALAAVLLGGGDLVLQVAMIWVTHIAVDRMLGYGLKLPTGFRDTHLGRIGRD